LGDDALNLGHLADLLFQSHSRKKVFDPSLYGCVGVSVNAIHTRRFAHSDHSRRLLLRRAENKQHTSQRLHNIDHEVVHQSLRASTHASFISPSSVSFPRGNFFFLFFLNKKKGNQNAGVAIHIPFSKFLPFPKSPPLHRALPHRSEIRRPCRCRRRSLSLSESLETSRPAHGPEIRIRRRRLALSISQTQHRPDNPSPTTLSLERSAPAPTDQISDAFEAQLALSCNQPTGSPTKPTIVNYYLKILHRENDGAGPSS
jgi:hypothetical protein